MGDLECFIAANNFYRSLPSSSTQFIAANIIKKQIHSISLHFNLNFCRRGFSERFLAHRKLWIASENVLPFHRALNSIYYEIRIFGRIASVAWGTVIQFRKSLWIFELKKYFPAWNLNPLFMSARERRTCSHVWFRFRLRNIAFTSIKLWWWQSGFKFKMHGIFREMKSVIFFGFNVLHD